MLILKYLLTLCVKMKSFAPKIFLVLSLLVSIFSSAQKQDIHSAVDTVTKLFHTDKTKALELCDYYLPQARELQDTFLITYFLDQAGEINRFKGNLYLAKGQLQECLKFKGDWEDKKDLSITHNNLGKTYTSLAEYDMSLKHFLAALKLMEETGNDFGQGFYLNNIGTNYDLQKNYTKAIEYYEKSLAFKEKTQDSIGMGANNLNIGITYFNLDKYERAIDYFENALMIEKYAEIPEKKVRIFSNLSGAYNALGDVQKALNFVNYAHSLRTEFDDEMLKLSIINNLTEYHLKLNNIDSALIYNNEVLSRTKETGAAKFIQRAYYLKADIMQAENLSDSAIYYLKQGIAYNDSLITEANINAVAEMESKYNLEKNKRLRQKAELETAKSNQKLTASRLQTSYLIIGCIVLFALIVLLFMRNRSNLQNSKLLEGQNVLIAQSNKKLNQLNTSIKEEVSSLKISIAEKDEILEKVFTTSQKDELPPELLSLSKREKEVLAHLALGLTDEQLANKLFVSKATVKTHLRRVYSKLLVKNRAEAVAMAHKYGIIGES